jgi:acyl carrier protein
MNAPNNTIIRSLVAEHGNLSTDMSKLSDTDDLYAHGLSSLATVQLMLAIEDAFEIELPERLLVRSTFESVAAIADAVAVLNP